MKNIVHIQIMQLTWILSFRDSGRLAAELFSGDRVAAPTVHERRCHRPWRTVWWKRRMKWMAIIGSLPMLGVSLHAQTTTLYVGQDTTVAQYGAGTGTAINPNWQRPAAVGRIALFGTIRCAVAYSWQAIHAKTAKCYGGTCRKRTECPDVSYQASALGVHV
jgi:hypothetical protein